MKYRVRLQKIDEALELRTFIMENLQELEDDNNIDGLYNDLLKELKSTEEKLEKLGYSLEDEEIVSMSDFH